MRSPESYFERDADDIRLKGHRMWLDDIVMLYKSGMTARQIASEYPTLSLAEAEAGITYYRTHTDEVDRYLEQQRQAVAACAPGGAAPVCGTGLVRLTKPRRK